MRPQKNAGKELGITVQWKREREVAIVFAYRIQRNLQAVVIVFHRPPLYGYRDRRGGAVRDNKLLGGIQYRAVQFDDRAVGVAACYHVESVSPVFIRGALIAQKELKHGLFFGRNIHGSEAGAWR